MAHFGIWMGGIFLENLPFRLLANIEKQLLDEKVRLDRDINNINKRERVSLETKQVLIGNAQKRKFHTSLCITI